MADLQERTTRCSDNCNKCTDEKRNKVAGDGIICFTGQVPEYGNISQLRWSNLQHREKNTHCHMN